MKSGYLSFVYAVEDLYVHPYTRPDVEFINELQPEVLELIGRKCSLETLIQKHTMFPGFVCIATRIACLYLKQPKQLLCRCGKLTEN